MDLKDFVSTTIKEITDGIIEGHKYIVDNKYGTGVSDEFYKTIAFDVAVTSQDESTLGGGGKLAVASMFSVGGSAENKVANTNYSRIQFEIRVGIKTANNKIV